MGLELTTLVVIVTDCLGSCKLNYHTITTAQARIKLMRIKTSFNVQRRVTRRQSKLHPYICTTLCYLVTIKTVSICTTLCHLVSIKTFSKCTTLYNLVTIKNVVKMYNAVSPCVNQTLSICTTQCHLVTIKHSQNVQRHATLCQSKHPQNVQPSVTLSICPT